MDYLSYKALYEERRKWYKTIGKVYCPCLKVDVIFNSKGFYHLRYDGLGNKRSIDTQISRLNLLPLVIPLIQQATNIYEYRISDDKSIQSWAIQGKINNINLRVILKKKLHGHTIYFSVMKKDSSKQKDHH
jgi:hypothetical protein